MGFILVKAIELLEEHDQRPPTCGIYAVPVVRHTKLDDDGTPPDPLIRSPASCPMRHTGYCFSGKLVMRMTGTSVEMRIGAGDFFEIPPGHDAYVEGAERVELVLFAPPEHQH